MHKANALMCFYETVMEDFFEKLYREYRHKKGLVDEEKITDFQTVPRHLLSGSRTIWIVIMPSPSLTAASR